MSGFMKDPQSLSESAGALSLDISADMQRRKAMFRALNLSGEHQG